MMETYEGHGDIDTLVETKVSDSYTDALNFCKSEQVQEIMADVDAQKCFSSQHKNNTSMKKEEAYINCSVHFNTAKLEDPNNYRLPTNNEAVNNAEIHKADISQPSDGSGKNNTKASGATSNN
jgi:hypothetical protein